MKCLVSDRILLKDKDIEKIKVFMSKYSKKYNVQVLNALWDDASIPCIKLVASEKLNMTKFIKKFKKSNLLWENPDFFSIGLFVESLCNIDGEPFI